MITDHDIIAFGEKLAAERDAAFNLWSWLPCHTFAERAHGDYACEFRWSHADEIKATSALLAVLAGYDILDSAEERSLFGCPCDDCPTPSRDEIVEVIEERYGRRTKVDHGGR